MSLSYPITRHPPISGMDQQFICKINYLLYFLLKLYFSYLKDKLSKLENI